MNLQQFLSQRTLLLDGAMGTIIKKTIFFALFVFILSACATKKQFSFNQGYVAQPYYYSVIPFEWISNKIIVPVEISGKVYRFIFDTGASNLVSETLYKDLEMPLLRKDILTDQSGIKDSALIVNMSSITLGNVLFRNIPAGVVNDSNPFLKCFGVEGVIGSNMLRNSAVKLSLRDTILTLTDNSQKLGINPENSLEMQLLPNQSLPFINIALVNINDSIGVTEDVLFDTGADSFYSVCMRNLDFFAPQNIFRQLASSTGSNTFGVHGNAVDALHYKLFVPLMLINNASLTNVLLTTNSGDSSVIGAKILKYGDVTLDYKNTSFNFEHFIDENENIYEKTFPIDPIYKNNHLIVGFVWDELLKEKISEGDRILFIDDVDYRHVEPCDLISNPSGLSNKDKITLTFQKTDGSIHKIEIEKK